MKKHNLKYPTISLSSCASVTGVTESEISVDEDPLSQNMSSGDASVSISCVTQGSFVPQPLIGAKESPGLLRKLKEPNQHDEPHQKGKQWKPTNPQMYNNRQIHILEGGVNHSAGAQDLFFQYMKQWCIDVAVIAEPYCVLSNPYWAGDILGTVAVVGSVDNNCQPLTILDRSEGFVSVLWEGLVIMGIYFSLNKTMADFVEYINQLSIAVSRASPRQVILMGDLNANATAWGSPTTDARGNVFINWAASMGLVLLNRGSRKTCVQRRAGSIVDITYATSTVANCVSNWRVLREETLSDHIYIRFEVSPLQHKDKALGVANGSRAPSWLFPSWCLKSLNRDLALEASIVEDINTRRDVVGVDIGVDEEASRLAIAMARISKASMLRLSSRPPRRHVYWWTSEIADLRIDCMAKRRALARYRRRRTRVEAEEDALNESLRVARKEMKIAICKEKTAILEQMLEDLDESPWDMPYRAMLGKLSSDSLVVDSLHPSLLREVMAMLFPERDEFVPPSISIKRHVSDNVNEPPPITNGEFDAAVQRLCAKTAAPGPDGIHGQILAIFLESLKDRVLFLFNACFVASTFPQRWKIGRLVLLQKPDQPANCPSSYLPIVLLDEIGKLLERIVANRITLHLSEAGQHIVNWQSTDAVNCSKALSDEEVAKGSVLFKESLDNANAFITLPFSCIEAALEYHHIPLYLQRLISSYLRGRIVRCIDKNGVIVQRSISCGVPQDSVLGPPLWNVSYNWAISKQVPPYYADLVSSAMNAMSTK